MKISLDANAYSDWKRGLFWMNEIAHASEVHVSSIVLGELRYGLSMGNAYRKNETELEVFLRSSVVHVDSVTDHTTHHYAALKKYLRKNGTPLPENDIWIAATCLEKGITLLTRDRHFEHLPQVRVNFGE